VFHSGIWLQRGSTVPSKHAYRKLSRAKVLRYHRIGDLAESVEEKSRQIAYLRIDPGSW
jgi:hypothetical protein